jgi:hypothetical protein
VQAAIPAIHSPPRLFFALGSDMEVAETMADTTDDRRMLGERAARQLSNTTKTPPYWVGSTPRWLVQMLPWTPVEAGVYRVNRVLDQRFAVECSPRMRRRCPSRCSTTTRSPASTRCRR